MTDVLTVEQRSRCMAAIRGKDTKPEMIVRRLVHALGYRYRLHVRSLPGCPDLVFRPRQKVIFVHGCFWHRHSCKLGTPVPRTRSEFWKAKLDGNVSRDTRNAEELQRLGWSVLVIWECEVTDIESVGRRIVEFIGGH